MNTAKQLKQSVFDFFPPRKEIFVENDPTRVLAAINSVTATLAPTESSHEQREIAKALAGRMTFTEDVKVVFPESRLDEVDEATRQRLLAVREGLKDNFHPLAGRVRLRTTRSRGPGRSVRYTEEVVRLRLCCVSP